MRITKRNASTFASGMMLHSSSTFRTRSVNVSVEPNVGWPGPMGPILLVLCTRVMSIARKSSNFAADKLTVAQPVNLNLQKKFGAKLPTRLFRALRSNSVTSRARTGDARKILTTTSNFQIRKLLLHFDGSWWRRTSRDGLQETGSRATLAFGASNEFPSCFVLWWYIQSSKNIIQQSLTTRLFNLCLKKLQKNTTSISCPFDSNR